MLDNVRKGERLVLNEQYLATVSMASPNGKALVIEFSAMVDGHIGTMPVNTDDGGNYSSLITGKPITLRRPTDDSETARLRGNDK